MAYAGKNEAASPNVLQALSGMTWEELVLMPILWP
jgi:hypothetical protein